jgi:hypothetical protein
MKSISTSGANKASVEKFIGALLKVLGKDNNFDDVLQAALDDPEVLKDIFLTLEKLRVTETNFSKAGGFNPAETKGGQESEFIPEIVDKVAASKKADKNAPVGDILKGAETLPPDRIPVLDVPRSEIKSEIRQALGAARSRISRNQPAAAPFGPEDLGGLNKAALALKTSLADNLRTPDTSKNVDPTLKEIPDEPAPMNHTDTIFDMEDINKGFEVQTIEAIEDYTGGRAGNLEELEEVLENLRRNPKATEKDITAMEDAVRVATDEEEALTKLEQKQEGIRDAVDCANENANE